MSEPQDGGGAAPDAGPAVDAGKSVDQMAEQLYQQRIRATLSDFEEQLAEKMQAAQQAFDAQRDQLAGQLKQMQGQLAAVRAKAGPPEAVTLAASLQTRLLSIAAANPDLPAGHFAGVIDQAARLNDAVKAAADGKGGTDEAARLADAIGTWFTRAHPRASNKYLEGMHAALDEAERIAEGLAKLAPVAAAIASAV